MGNPQLGHDAAAAETSLPHSGQFTRAIETHLLDLHTSKGVCGYFTKNRLFVKRKLNNERMIGMFKVRSVISVLVVVAMVVTVLLPLIAPIEAKAVDPYLPMGTDAYLNALRGKPKDKDTDTSFDDVLDYLMALGWKISASVPVVGADNDALYADFGAKPWWKLSVEEKGRYRDSITKLPDELVYIQYVIKGMGVSASAPSAAASDYDAALAAAKDEFDKEIGGGEASAGLSNSLESMKRQWVIDTYFNGKDLGDSVINQFINGNPDAMKNFNLVTALGGDLPTQRELDPLEELDKSKANAMDSSASSIIAQAQKMASGGNGGLSVNTPDWVSAWESPSFTYPTGNMASAATRAAAAAESPDFGYEMPTLQKTNMAGLLESKTAITGDSLKGLYASFFTAPGGGALTAGLSGPPSYTFQLAGGQQDKFGNFLDSYSQTMAVGWGTQLSALVGGGSGYAASGGGVGEGLGEDIMATGSGSAWSGTSGGGYGFNNDYSWLGGIQGGMFGSNNSGWGWSDSLLSSWDRMSQNFANTSLRTGVSYMESLITGFQVSLGTPGGGSLLTAGDMPALVPDGGLLGGSDLWDDLPSLGGPDDGD
jgi:hypothetical protein